MVKKTKAKEPVFRITSFDVETYKTLIFLELIQIFQLFADVDCSMGRNINP